MAPFPTPMIDDLSRPFPATAFPYLSEFISDRVMGGVSSGTLTREVVAGRLANRLRGEVSLANNGGFLQMALDLDPTGAPLDCGAFTGIAIEVSGNGEDYGLHLRTAGLTRPWQSYRQGFRAGGEWHTIRLPFTGFEAHRTDLPLDPAQLRRIGLVAIGRAFTADLAVASVSFY